MTTHRPESVWVTILSQDDGVFTGKVLNAPHQLTSVRQNEVIRFVAATGTEHAVMVTERYLGERDRWKITPCSKCGFRELLDAPSELIPVIFPSMPADAGLESFTTFCGLCGGVQAVEAVKAGSGQVSRPWWKFWQFT